MIRSPGLLRSGPRRGCRALDGKSIGSVAALAVLAVSSGAQATEPFPTLATALERIRTHSTAVVAARGGLRAAEAMGAGARLSSVGNPYLEVFADRTLARPTSEVSLQSNLWIPVDVSGQRRRRIDENGRLSDWRSAQLAEVNVGAAAELVKRYGVAVTDFERVRFLQKVIVISEQEAGLYESRVNAGDATLQDAKLAAVELSRNRMALGQARADLARALAELAMMLGASELSSPEVGRAPPATIWSSAEVAPDRMIDEAPALRALEREANYFAALESREAVEGHAPVNLIVSAGQGTDGAARVGGGLAWTFPLLRRNQGDRARARAERERALDVAAALRRELQAVLLGLVSERAQVLAALEELHSHGEPAAQAAVEAALAVERAGKGELLHVVTARRDLVSVRASGLALQEREWDLLARLVALTGRNP